MTTPDKHHTVTIDFEYHYTPPHFECTAPVGAACRSMPSCMVTGRRCADHEGGHADRCPGALELDLIADVDSGECLVETWVENTDEAGTGDVTLPVATQWTGDYWQWTPVVPPSTDDLVAALRREHWVTLADRWGAARWVPVCGRCAYGDGVSMRWPCPTMVVCGLPDPPPLVEGGDMRHAVDHLIPGGLAGYTRWSVHQT